MLLRRAALFALLPLAVAGCDSKILSNLPGFGKSAPPATAEVPAATATPRAPAVSPLEVPIEVEGQRTTLGTANAAFVDVSAFTASGQGWLAAVRGSNAAIRRPGVKDAQVNVRRVDFGQGTEFVGTYGDSTASINLRAGECRDASGAVWPMSATLRMSGSKLTGCAAPTGSEAKGFAAELPVPKPVAAPVVKKVAVKKAAPKKAAPKAAVKPAEPAPTAPTPSTPAPTTTPAAPATPTPATPAPAPTTPATPPAPAAPAPMTPATPTPATPAPAAPASAATTAPAVTPAPAPAPTTPAATTPAPAATGSSTPVPVIIPPVN